MSILGVKPYIEAKLDALSEQQLTALATLINASVDDANVYTLDSLRTSLTQDTIMAAKIQFNPACYRAGYLVFKKNAFCTFISKELNYEGRATIYDLDLAKLKYYIVKEECSIEEIRRIIALGSGSVSITVDSALSTTSENPVQNKAITNALTQIVELSGLTGTLSDSNYAKVAADNCLIKVSTQYYYKAFDASTLLIYQALSRQAGQDQALFDYVEITKSTKVYEVKASNIVEGNPTVPSGTSPETLSGLKVGETYYEISQSQGGYALRLKTYNPYTHMEEQATGDVYILGKYQNNYGWHKVSLTGNFDVSFTNVAIFIPHMSKTSSPYAMGYLESGTMVSGAGDAISAEGSVFATYDTNGEKPVYLLDDCVVDIYND